jgi:hypothetical protein
MTAKLTAFIVLTFFLVSCNRQLLIKHENYIKVTDGYIIQIDKAKFFLPHGNSFTSNTEIIQVISKQHLFGVGMSHVYIPSKLNSNFYTTFNIKLLQDTTVSFQLEVYPCTLFTYGPLKIESETVTEEFVYENKTYKLNYTMDLGHIFYKFEPRDVW